MKMENFSAIGSSRIESIDSDDLNVDGIKADDSDRIGSRMDIV